MMIIKDIFAYLVKNFIIRQTRNIHSHNFIK